MTRLLALDPGGTSGWSTWLYSPLTPLEPIDHGQIEGGLEGFLQWWDVETMIRRPWDEMVAETFVLDGRTVKPDTTPLLIEGALHVLFPGWVGQRNVMKAQADDLLLKRADYWWPGEQRARDSASHAIALMKTRRHLPTIKMLWPPRGE